MVVVVSGKSILWWQLFSVRVCCGGSCFRQKYVVVVVVSGKSMLW